MAIFLDDFSDESDVLINFGIKPAAIKGAAILVASYETGNYEGQAFVLFTRDGKLFEVNASHCSCFGLEDQWEPEEVSIEALRHRFQKRSDELGKAVLSNLDSLQLVRPL